MPRPKLPNEVVDLVVELLLCGWTPQNIYDHWTANPACNDPGSGGPSLGAIQRIAKVEGLARQRGGARLGAGKPRGGRGGGGRPKGPGRKFSTHRDEVRRLRNEGHSLRVIAGLVGLRSPQQVANLLSDE